MALFDIAYKLTNGVEGEYSNRATDPGGETWRAIARKKNPQWDGWPVIDLRKKQKDFPDNLKGNPQLNALHRAFFLKEFWNELNLTEFKDQAIANKVYDIGVNTGQSTAGKLLQRVLNGLNKNGKLYPDLPITGNIRSATLHAVNTHPRPDIVFKGLNCLQGEYYFQITEKNANLEEYLNGLIDNRIAALQPELHNDIA